MTNEDISTMDQPQNTIIKAVLTLLSTTPAWRTYWPKVSIIYIKREPELELNKPSNNKSNGFKQKKIYSLFAVFNPDAVFIQ